jgi:hypothetical protein
MGQEAIVTETRVRVLYTMLLACAPREHHNGTHIANGDTGLGLRTPLSQATRRPRNSVVHADPIPSGTPRRASVPLTLRGTVHARVA